MREQAQRSARLGLPDLSDIVYVPAHPGPEPDRGVVCFETRCLASGEAVGWPFAADRRWSQLWDQRSREWLCRWHACR